MITVILAAEAVLAVYGALAAVLLFRKPRPIKNNGAEWLRERL